MILKCIVYIVDKERCIAFEAICWSARDVFANKHKFADILSKRGPNYIQITYCFNIT